MYCTSWLRASLMHTRKGLRILIFPQHLSSGHRYRFRLSLSFLRTSERAQFKDREKNGEKKEKGKGRHPDPLSPLVSSPLLLHRSTFPIALVIPAAFKYGWENSFQRRRCGKKSVAGENRVQRDGRWKGWLLQTFGWCTSTTSISEVILQWI